MGVFSVAGILVAAGVTWFVLPRLIAAAELAPVAAGNPRLLARLEAMRRWSPVAGATALACLCFLLVTGVPWDGELTHLSPVPARALALDDELRSELGAPETGQAVVVEGASAGAVLEREENLSATLRKLVQDKALAGFDDAAQVLPSERTQREHAAMLPDTAALRTEVATASQGLGFTAGAFAPFLQDVARAKSLPPLDASALPAALANDPLLSARIGALLFQWRDRWYGLVAPRGLADPARLAAAVAGIDGVTYIDTHAETNRIAAIAAHGARSWLLGGVCAAVAALAAGLRDPTRLLRVLGSIAASLAVTLTILKLSGQSLTLVHVLALQFVAGIGLDYALFFSRPGLDEEERLRTLRTLVTCNAHGAADFWIAVRLPDAAVARHRRDGERGRRVCDDFCIPAGRNMAIAGMTPLFLTASTIVSALGAGEAATLAALRSGQTGLTRCDFPDAPPHGFIGRVPGLDHWRLPSHSARFQCRNNALADMALEDEEFRAAIARARARYGAGRIATVVGTSTSGILAAEEAYPRRDAATGALPADFSYDYSYDLSSVSRFVQETLALRGPVSTVSAACASSARAFIDAHDLIAAGFADAAVVGGADSLCRLTLQGFASLELIAPGCCRPCDAGRNGISIGEAAGFVLLERTEAKSGSVALLGAGGSSDGYHISQPRPDGAGAAQAMRAALDSARLAPGDIGYINLHGTATRANDAMEDAAVTAVFGATVPCSSTKGLTGHTMGSCGIVEAVIAKLCLIHGFAPACTGMESVDPAFSMTVLAQRHDAPLRAVLSNSFGFGGMNCSLVFGTA